MTEADEAAAQAHPHWLRDNANLKFLFILLPPLMGAAILVSAGLSYLQFRSLEKELSEKKISLLTSNATALASPLFNLDSDNALQILEILAIDEDVAGAEVYNENGVLIASLPPDPAIASDDLEEVQRAILYSSGVTEVEDFPVGRLTVYFRTDRILNTVLDRSLNDYLLALTMVAVMIFSAVFATRHIFIRPLMELLEGIRQTETQRRRDPLPVKSGDALGRVIVAYNRLLEQLDSEEQEAEKAARLFRILADNSVDFITLNYPEGSYTYISPSAKRITGYTAEELLKANSVWPFILEEDHKLIMERREKVRRGEANLNDPIILRFRRKDGEVRWIEAISQIVDDPENPGQHLILGRSHDITEIIDKQKELERSRDDLVKLTKELEDAKADVEASHAELKRRSRLFQVLADNARDFIVLRNEDGDYTYCSPSAERFTGVSSAELMASQSVEKYMDTRGGRALYAIHERFHRGMPLPTKPKLISAVKATGQRTYMEVLGALVPDPDQPDKNALMLTAHDVTDLIHNQHALTKTTEELEESRQETERALDTIQRDIALAKSMQEAILPSVFPAHPRYEASGYMESARQVGGDFYEFFQLGTDKIGIAMADVSGKGVPAAFFMAVSRTLLETAAKTGRPPSAVLDDVNQRLCNQNPLSLFVTVFYGILDLKLGTFIYSNGGHNPPMIVTPTGQVSELQTTGNMMLGLMSDAKYVDRNVTLKTGDTVVLYTDGITEAFDPNNNMFGEERLIDALAGSANAPVEDMLQAVRQSVAAFVKGAEQSDDVTALALRFNASASAADRMDRFHGKVEPISADARLKLEMVNSLEQLSSIQSQMEEFCEVWGVPPDCQFQLNVSLEEYLVNLVSYGYDAESRHIIQINLTRTREGLTLEVLDDAEPFDPLTVPEPEMKDSLEEREIGGLGIHLIRSYMDQLSYQSRHDVNRFTMVKYLN